MVDRDPLVIFSLDDDGPHNWWEEIRPPWAIILYICPARAQVDDITNNTL